MGRIFLELRYQYENLIVDSIPFTFGISGFDNIDFFLPFQINFDESEMIIF